MPQPTTFHSELGALGLLLGPILVSQLSQAAFGFVDTVMAGQASPLDLAAVALGASIWLPLMLLTTGTLLATTPLVAAARGRGNLAEIPHIAHQALWLALPIGLLGAALLHFVDPVFHLLDTPPHLRDLTRRFLAAIAWGLPAAALFAVLRNYCEGMGRPLPVTLISLAGLLLLVPLNYVLIHGLFGLPRLGGVGCGVASAIVSWLMLLMLLAYVLKSSHFASVRLLHERSRPEFARLLAFLRLGVPIGIAIFFEVSVFAIVAILISPLGELQVAGHQIALSVTSLLFMFPLSFAFCMTIRVGHAYGRNDIAAIRHTRRIGLMALTIFATLSAAFIVLARDSLTALYTDDPAVRLLAADLLLFAAAYQIVDALQVGAAGSLRGLHDTRGPMVMTLIAYWLIALPLGYVLGMTYLTGERYGPYGFWAGLVVGLTVAALLLNHRLARQLRKLEGACPDQSTGTPAKRS
jgi:MATE family multidrug resistance protein